MNERIRELAEQAGIGYELKASFEITYKDTDGNFVVSITDHRDW